jgi:hypothetical protein
MLHWRMYTTSHSLTAILARKFPFTIYRQYLQSGIRSPVRTQNGRCKAVTKTTWMGPWAVNKDAHSQRPVWAGAHVARTDR